MSAIAKPFMHTITGVTNLINGVSPLVCIERVTAIDIVETPNTANHSASPKFEIVFTMAQDPKTGIPGEVKWAFPDRATLDTEYAKIVTLISAVIV